MSRKAALFGNAVAAAGDVNGDGYDDLLVAAPRYEQDVYREGAIFLHYGGPAGLEEQPGWMAASGQKGAEFGASLATAGDVNGDGYADFLAGAPRFNSDSTPQSEEGAAFLYYGTASNLGPAESARWAFEGDRALGHVGAAVASAGDVNHDGYADVIVGADLYSNDDINQGRVFVFLGSASGLSKSPDWTYESHQTGSRFGAAVGAAGDANGDGYGDLFVGAPGYDDLQENSGGVFIFFGGRSGPTSNPPWMLVVDQAEANFGISAAALGDLDGDGYDDLLVGAPGYSNGLFGDGAAFLFRGGAAAPAFTGWKAWIPQAGSRFGAVVAAAGDVNQDGWPDALVGAPNYTGDHLDEGALFLYYGGPQGLGTTYRWMAAGEKADTDFAISSGAAGDVNGDGYTDVVAGAPAYFLGTEPLGRAFVFLGRDDRELEVVYSLHLPLVRR